METGADIEASPRLSVRGITKSFGAVRACEDVSFDLPRGAIVALLGENGAGKSTLVKMLFGSLQPDAGEIHWEGRRVSIPEPAAARALGIGMVHQHFSLFDAFTVAENIALGMDGDPPLRRVASEAERLSASYGLPLQANALVADLSVGERQRVEVVRCLMQDPSLVIMDEPTSVLTPSECETLFEALRTLRDEGRTILYISHKLEEVRALCSDAIVMRAGRVVHRCDPREVGAADLARAMVGSSVPAISAPRKELSGRSVLQLDHLNVIGEGAFATRLRNVSLEVKAGEVFGIAGMAGNGQAELFGAISGERPVHDENAVRINGEPVGDLGIDQRRALGAAFVPAERLSHAALSELSLSDNVILSRHGRSDGTIRSAGFLRRAGSRSIAADVIERMDVRTAGFSANAGTLSGGNLQKFIMGREFDRSPTLLVVDQPTWGVDAGSASHVRQSIVDLASAGTAVLVISQDLDELLEIADRIAVLNRGHLREPHDVRSVSRERLGLEMGDASDNLDNSADVLDAA